MAWGPGKASRLLRGRGSSRLVEKREEFLWLPLLRRGRAPVVSHTTSLSCILFVQGSCGQGIVRSRRVPGHRRGYPAPAVGGGLVDHVAPWPARDAAREARATSLHRHPAKSWRRSRSEKGDNLPAIRLRRNDRMQTDLFSLSQRIAIVTGCETHGNAERPPLRAGNVSFCAWPVSDCLPRSYLFGYSMRPCVSNWELSSLGILLALPRVIRNTVLAWGRSYLYGARDLKWSKQSRAR